MRISGPKAAILVIALVVVLPAALLWIMQRGFAEAEQMIGPGYDLARYLVEHPDVRPKTTAELNSVLKETGLGSLVRFPKTIHVEPSYSIELLINDHFLIHVAGGDPSAHLEPRNSQK